jgi:hypothetical protein
MDEVSKKHIPLLVRGVDATLRKCREASFEGADGVVAHTERCLVNDHPVCGDTAATPSREEGTMPS